MYKLNKQYYKQVCLDGPLGKCGHLMDLQRDRWGIFCNLTAKNLTGSRKYDGCVNHTNFKESNHAQIQSDQSAGTQADSQQSI